MAGDTRFPDIDPARWRETDRIAADGYAFVSYDRRAPVTDLRVLLSTMRPELHDGEFEFCTLPAGTRHSGWPAPGGDGCRRRGHNTGAAGR